MTANELDPRSVGGMAGQGGSISSAAPSNSPGGAADLDLDAITQSRSTVDGSTTRTCARLTTRDAIAMLDQLNADREQSRYWQSKWAETHGDQNIEAWLDSLADWLPTTRHNTTETTDHQSRPVVGSVAHVVDLDAIEARWLQICGHCDVDVLIAEVRALRAEVAALNAETRAGPELDLDFWTRETL